MTCFFLLRLWKWKIWKFYLSLQQSHLITFFNNNINILPHIYNGFQIIFTAFSPSYIMAPDLWTFNSKPASIKKNVVFVKPIELFPILLPLFSSVPQITLWPVDSVYVNTFSSIFIFPIEATYCNGFVTPRNVRKRFLKTVCM